MPAFTIKFDASAWQELREIRKFDRVAIVDAIEVHLSDEPMRVSKSRIKKLSHPMIGDFRLAVGDWRVLYNVEADLKLVYVVAVRHKGRQTLAEAAHGEDT